MGFFGVMSYTPFTNNITPPFWGGYKGIKPEYKHPVEQHILRFCAKFDPQMKWSCPININFGIFSYKNSKMFSVKALILYLYARKMVKNSPFQLIGHLYPRWIGNCGPLVRLYSPPRQRVLGLHAPIRRSIHNFFRGPLETQNHPHVTPVSEAL
jgi:hypothetical protein